VYEADDATIMSVGRTLGDNPTVGFAPIQALRAHEYVAEQIRRHIALRLILPGEALPPERELVSMFGVGRPTLQHALRLLEAERLITARRGRHGGTFVLAPSDDDHGMEELLARLLRRRAEFEELLDYRRVTEPMVARVAAATRRKVDVLRMQKAIRGMARAVTAPDYPVHLQFDSEFHIAIAAATRNRYLVRSAEELRIQLNDVLSLLPENPRSLSPQLRTENWHRQLSREHEAIFAAIEDGDADAANVAVEMHVVNTELSVRALLTAMRRRALALEG
jgi:GntR family transcriptional repressor for pyruvate dehydrogenase complex